MSYHERLLQLAAEWVFKATRPLPTESVGRGLGLSRWQKASRLMQELEGRGVVERCGQTVNGITTWRWVDKQAS